MEKIERAHETLRSLSILMAIEAFLSRKDLSPFRTGLWAAGPIGADATRRMAANLRVSLAKASEQSAVHASYVAGVGSIHNLKRHYYSMTSSARSKIDCGTVRPSALAVLRFTTISNLVGNCTGRSPGFSPRRMRST